MYRRQFRCNSRKFFRLLYQTWNSFCCVSIVAFKVYRLCVILNVFSIRYHNKNVLPFIVRPQNGKKQIWLHWNDETDNGNVNKIAAYLQIKIHVEINFVCVMYTNKFWWFGDLNKILHDFKKHYNRILK